MCSLCRYERLGEFLKESRAIKELIRRQNLKISCKFCEVQYSSECKYGFYFCTPCKIFFESIHLKSNEAIKTSTIEKLMNFASSGYIDKYMAHNLKSKKYNEIFNILENETTSNIQKFKRDSIY